jgi:polysaccharide pyruvyl transferase WcaK-like protein
MIRIKTDVGRLALTASPPLHKRIVILDTSIGGTNLGNEIIMDAVNAELRATFPHDIFYRLPAHEYIKAGRDILLSADYVHIGGTNLLRCDLNSRESWWPVKLTDILWMRGLVLMGVGWCGYQEGRPNWYSRLLLHRILRKDCCHSVRDRYTLAKLQELGFQTVNTGCPTLWRLTEAHCKTIPCQPSGSVLFTFTEYNQDFKRDALTVDILKRTYRRLFYWPQMYGDLPYARQICGSAPVEYLDPSLDALNQCLDRETVDYVGTRLHAGIRAMQKGRRSIIIAIDNRAVEMGGDFGLPVIRREDIETGLEGRILQSWKTVVHIDEAAIATWRRQFGPPG